MRWPTIDFKSLDTYIHGGAALIVAACGTALVAGVSTYYDGKSINWNHLGIIMAFTSISTAAAYVAKTPLPNVLQVQGPGTISVPEGTTAIISSKPTTLPATEPMAPDLIPRPSTPESVLPTKNP